MKQLDSKSAVIFGVSGSIIFPALAGAAHQFGFDILAIGLGASGIVSLGVAFVGYLSLPYKKT